ncbi:hypothetical protein Rleg_5918 (plasmid) [Rhizobium leguminosarum bv. trifolii WSM1325]|uniref:Uncharacterized protein n=1 Tax=Rhizobium leguminosarum bv. trifolii (strain WSM1325) TaxID=395491 RepID=C6B8F1_RHILS|nr:hypothetical protein Rleg_5918 [Rhizobium leguminosarum bv. trifolii WSM1325]
MNKNSGAAVHFQVWTQWSDARTREASTQARSFFPSLIFCICWVSAACFCEAANEFSRHGQQAVRIAADEIARLDHLGRTAEVGVIKETDITISLAYTLIHCRALMSENLE